MRDKKISGRAGPVINNTGSTISIREKKRMSKLIVLSKKRDLKGLMIKFTIIKTSYTIN